MDNQLFDDYKSKYLDIYDKVRTSIQKEQVSILGEVDFETEVIHRDDINVAYIVSLMAKMSQAHSEEEAQKQHEKILSTIANEVEMRSKQELIRKFIDSNLPKIGDVEDIPRVFAEYWDEEKQMAFDQLCQEEGIDPERLTEVVGQFLFTEREPLNEDIADMLENQPEVLKYQEVIARVKYKVLDLVNTFMKGAPIA